MISETILRKIEFLIEFNELSVVVIELTVKMGLKLSLLCQLVLHFRLSML